ncbi:MAG TPA: phosphoribosylglycinamide formyltransferase [Pyrinomonadaceae bacterium]|nr:phosphoribosylglycinamide formyltransferase [Pyrinomonadaceae bacterium]
MIRLGILISGRGSNMLALASAIREGRIPDAEIAVVLSDHANAAGLTAARDQGLKVETVERHGRSRQEHDEETVAVLRKHEVEMVCLAGYMRVLSGQFLEAFPQKILNIHPSLLPAFPGLNAQLQALEHGVKVTGCTVHFVDETLDGGPIVAQRVVPVYDNDTEETLSARILQQEHELYPEAVATVTSHAYRIVNRRVLPGSE